MSSPNKNQTQDLVLRPKDKSIVGCKWAYKIKERTSESETVRYKVRFVAKGYTQKEGINYNEFFSLVVKYITIRIMLAFVAYYDGDLNNFISKSPFYIVT